MHKYTSMYPYIHAPHIYTTHTYTSHKYTFMHMYMHTHALNFKTTEEYFNTYEGIERENTIKLCNIISTIFLKSFERYFVRILTVVGFGCEYLDQFPFCALSSIFFYFSIFSTISICFIIRRKLYFKDSNSESKWL